MVSASAVKVGTVTPAAPKMVRAPSGWFLEKDGTVFRMGVGLHLVLRSSALGVAELENLHISREGFTQMLPLPRLQGGR